MVAWRGPTTVAAGLGAFDTRRIEDLLWDRLLPPRERGETTVTRRAWGLLGRTPTALGVWNACSFVAWSEGPEGVPQREVDRLLSPPAAAGEASSEEALARWHGAASPAALRGRAPEALLEGVRDVDLAAALADDGVRVTLRLGGAIPPDAERRTRRAIAALVDEPIGHAVGAAQWLRDERVSVAVEPGGLRLEAVAPWAALEALADVLRGRVGAAPGGPNF
jgi:hypothetical protein